MLAVRAQVPAGQPWRVMSRTTQLRADNRSSLKGAEMIDTLRLFDSLNQATEFTGAEDHLKLLRHTYDIYWDPGEGHGAPAINPKKPYGNSAVPQDVAKILEAPD